MKKFLNKKTIAVILVCGLLVLGVALRGRERPVAVLEVTPEKTDVIKSISASGTITSIDVADLSFASGGKITKIYVEKGDSVPKGALLAQVFNSPDYQTIQAAKDSRDVAQRDLDLYIEQYNTNRDAVGGSDEYTIGVRRLQELLSRAEATYEAQAAGIQNTYIYAPFEATIIDVLKEEGEIAVPGSTVIKVADLSNLVFEASIDQEDFGLLKEGHRVSITLDAYPDAGMEGVIEDIPLYADSVTNEFTLKIKVLAGKETQVLLGMSGDVDIVLAEEKDVQALLFDSIFSDSGGNYVWVMDDTNKVGKKYVEIGLEGDIYTEIKTDLSDTKLVVPSDNDIELKEGISVKVTER